MIGANGDTEHYHSANNLGSSQTFQFPIET